MHRGSQPDINWLNRVISHDGEEEGKIYLELG